MPRKRPAAADLASTEVVAKKSRSSAPLPPACVQSSKRLEKEKMTRSSKKQMDSNFSTKRCKSWFHEYSAKEDTIGPEGMEKFCEDIGVEPENIVMLVLAYKLGAKQMGFFTLSEWQSGMTALQCDCTEKLRGKLDYLRSLLNDTHLFKAVFRYAYDFAVEKGQRSLDMQTSIAMLSLLLGKQWPLYSHFLQYLEQSKYKVVNKDQWYNVLEFAKQVHPDLSNYDEDGAWPVLLDEFVEWYRKQIQTTSEPSENVSNTEARGNGLVNGHHTLNTF